MSNRYKDYLKQFDVSGTVIDIGGSAKPIRGRTKSWSVNKYLILDNGLEYKVKKETWTKADKKFDLNRSVWNDGEIADWVFCIATMNYVWNPSHAIKQIYRMLKKGGKAVITFSLIYPHSGIVKADSLRYTRAGVENLLKYAGFKSWKIETINTEFLGLLMEFYSKENMHKSPEVNHSQISFIVCVKK